MKTRIDSLRRYLTSVVKLQTENFRIFVEKGQATAEFHTEEQFTALQDAIGIVLGVVPVAPDEHFHMINTYSLSLHVQNYAGDYDALVRLILFWLNSHVQDVSLDYVIEQNNNETVDLWFDMQITEGSRNDAAGGVHTC